jgi:hypothetical protein
MRYSYLFQQVYLNNLGSKKINKYKKNELHGLGNSLHLYINTEDIYFKSYKLWLSRGLQSVVHGPQEVRDFHSITNITQNIKEHYITQQNILCIKLFILMEIWRSLLKTFNLFALFLISYSVTHYILFKSELYILHINTSAFIT